MEKKKEITVGSDVEQAVSKVITMDELLAKKTAEAKPAYSCSRKCRICQFYERDYIIAGSAKKLEERCHYNGEDILVGVNGSVKVNTEGCRHFKKV